MEKERHNSQLPMARCLAIRGYSIDPSSFTTEGFWLLEEPTASTSFSVVSKLLQPYRIDTEAIGSSMEGGNGTSPGGIYLSINTDIATVVNARSVPTLTCRRQARYTLVLHIQGSDILLEMILKDATRRVHASHQNCLRNV